MLNLLTTTGERPEAWALCQRWMARQTYAGPVRWIVVDDGEQPQPITFERDGWELAVVRPLPFWRPGQNTQARNLLAGLAGLTVRDRVAIIEDDDWYAPDWLEQLAGRLKGNLLLGESHARYYNVARRIGRQLRNGAHASLCATAASGTAIEMLRAVAGSAPTYIDLQLWRKHKPAQLLSGHRVVGIKGLPGRGGIGVGHKDTFSGDADPAGELLRSWIGTDAEAYL